MQDHFFVIFFLYFSIFSISNLDLGVVFWVVLVGFGWIMEIYVLFQGLAILSLVTERGHCGDNC